MLLINVLRKIIKPNLHGLPKLDVITDFVGVRVVGGRCNVERPAAPLLGRRGLIAAVHLGRLVLPLVAPVSQQRWEIKKKYFKKKKENTLSTKKESKKTRI